MQKEPTLQVPFKLTLDQDLLSEARSSGVNLSRAAEAGIRRALTEALAWKRENTKALLSSNTWVEKNGLPLEQYRLF